MDKSAILENFRTKVTTDLGLVKNPEDHFLLRWLQARDFNLEKAVIMFKNYVEWREHNSAIKSVLDGSWQPSNEIIQGMKYEVTGFDFEGRPVFWMPIGEHHTRQLCENGHRSDLQKFTFYICEQLMKRIDEQRQEKPNVTQIVAILDMDELYFKKVAHYETIQFLLTFLKDFEAFYPELLYSAFIINASWVFSYIFGIMKPLLSSRTIGKIQIYTNDQAKWKPALLSQIPINSLPLEYQTKLNAK